MIKSLKSCIIRFANYKNTHKYCFSCGLCICNTPHKPHKIDKTTLKLFILQ
nr:MAG TPA: protein of unknown function (DUF4187) [Caudoviricetes sp.]